MKTGNYSYDWFKERALKSFRLISPHVWDYFDSLLGKPILFMRHERVEAAPGSPTVRIFAIGFEGKLESGEVKLSPRHTELLWADPKDFKPEDYFKGGWLKGMQEYIALWKNS